jgi:hypothetical protein
MASASRSQAGCHSKGLHQCLRSSFQQFSPVLRGQLFGLGARFFRCRIGSSIFRTSATTIPSAGARGACNVFLGAMNLRIGTVTKLRYLRVEVRSKSSSNEGSLVREARARSGSLGDFPTLRAVAMCMDPRSRISQASGVRTTLQQLAVLSAVEPPPHRSKEKFNMGRQAMIWSRMPPYTVARTGSLA